METRNNEANGGQHLINDFPPPSLIPRQECPWLLMSSSSSEKSQVFFNLMENRTYTRLIPELCGEGGGAVVIYHCHNGWLVLSETSTNSWCLLNITTMEKVQLPSVDDFDYVYDYLHCVTSSTPTPTDANCRMLFISDNYEYFLSYQFGAKEFRRQELILEVDYIILDAINFRNQVYVISYPTFTLHVADFTDPYLEFRPLIDGDESLSHLLTHNTRTTYSYLVGSDEELWYLHKTGYATEVINFQIFRADFSTKSWVKLQSISDRVIFLDVWKGVSYSPACGCRGINKNCIYFTQRKDRNLYIFDMEDQSISITLPSPDVNPDKLVPYWVFIPVEHKL